MCVTCTSAADACATLVSASPGSTGVHSTARSASAIGRVRKASMARCNSAKGRAVWSLRALEPALAAEQSEHMCILKGGNADASSAPPLSKAPDTGLPGSPLGDWSCATQTPVGRVGELPSGPAGQQSSGRWRGETYRQAGRKRTGSESVVQEAGRTGCQAEGAILAKVEHGNVAHQQVVRRHVRIDHVVL